MSARNLRDEGQQIKHNKLYTATNNHGVKDSKLPKHNSLNTGINSYGSLAYNINNSNITKELNKAGLEVGIHSAQGRRPYQEDEYLICPNAHKFSPDFADTLDTHVFAVFDGHAGGRCSKAVSAEFSEALAKDLCFKTKLPTALRNAFQKTNESFLKVAERLRLNDGSTGCVCVLRGRRLLVGNVGDSRAILLQDRKAVQLSTDHKPSNPDEMRRISALGGTVINCMGVPRVNGILAVARAFGNYGIRHVIKADPDIFIREITPEDDYIIIASDGMWDVLRNKDVGDICYSMKNESCQRLAEELVRTALNRGSMDNTTCMVISLAGYLANVESIINPNEIHESDQNISSLTANSVTTKDTKAASSPKTHSSLSADNSLYSTLKSSFDGPGAPSGSASYNPKATVGSGQDSNRKNDLSLTYGQLSNERLLRPSDFKYDRSSAQTPSGYAHPKMSNIAGLSDSNRSHSNSASGGKKRPATVGSLASSQSRPLSQSAASFNSDLAAISATGSTMAIGNNRERRVGTTASSNTRDGFQNSLLYSGLDIANIEELAVIRELKQKDKMNYSQATGRAKSSIRGGDNVSSIQSQMMMQNQYRGLQSRGSTLNNSSLMNRRAGEGSNQDQKIGVNSSYSGLMNSTGNSNTAWKEATVSTNTNISNHNGNQTREYGQALAAVTHGSDLHNVINDISNNNNNSNNNSNISRISDIQAPAISKQTVNTPQAILINRGGSRSGRPLQQSHSQSYGQNSSGIIISSSFGALGDNRSNGRVDQQQSNQLFSKSKLAVTLNNRRHLY